MPDEVNQLMINVNMPQGQMDVVNPLYNYTFHPQPSAMDFPPSDYVSLISVTIQVLGCANLLPCSQRLPSYSVNTDQN